MEDGIVSGEDGDTVLDGGFGDFFFAKDIVREGCGFLQIFDLFTVIIGDEKGNGTRSDVDGRVQFQGCKKWVHVALFIRLIWQNNK